MAYNRLPNYTFLLETDTGLDEVPEGACVIVKDYEGEAKIFVKTENFGVDSNTTLGQAFQNGKMRDNSGTGNTSYVTSSPVISGSNIIANGLRVVSISLTADSFLVGGRISSFDIDWNDGSAIETVLTEQGTSSATATHTYPTDEVDGTTLDITATATDISGNISSSVTHTFTYRDNLAPTGTITSDITDFLFIGDTPVNFTGATDSDGTVVSYRVENISDSRITVATPTIAAGSSHTFTVPEDIKTVETDPDVAFTFSVVAIDDKGSEGATTDFSLIASKVFVTDAIYTVPGDYSWLCPSGVTSISLVVVGAGGGRTASTGQGGNGGALAWKNNLPVTPGVLYDLTVGANSATTDGGFSQFFNGDLTVKAGGGFSSSNSVMATPLLNFDGGGNGGRGGWGGSTYEGGGGGAGGYAGNGGNGGYGDGSTVGAYDSSTAINSTERGTAGAGGGAGGGAYGGGYAGGQIGLFGQGSSGAAGCRCADGWGALNNGSSDISPDTPIAGGGTPGGSDSGGGHGAVRIIWGAGRSFPTSAN